jgi:hypothetical protein
MPGCFSPPVRILPVVLLFLFPAGVSDAQVPDEGPSSIGFVNPDSTQPVRAYRLPTWHWSTWTLEANGGANRRGARLGDSEADEYDVALGLAPTYRSFWESEARRAFLRFSPSIELLRTGRTDSNGGSEQERDLSRITTAIDLRGTIREYVSGRTFLFGATDGTIDYDRERDDIQRDENDVPEQTQTIFRARANLRLGIGVGRVRVVTPVIRALRVRERLRTVAPGSSVSDTQVQAAARQLARRPGYQAVYDRPDKYFWRDFFDQVNLAERSAFETFYVADVLREPVGLRREGAEFVAGPFGTYDRDLRRKERDDQLVDRSCFEAGTVGGFARGRWYRNVTLRHQLGVDAEATYRNFVDSQGPLDHELGLDAEGQWLWVLADRLRLDTRLRANVRFQSDPRGGETFRPSHLYLLSSDLVLFIENSLSLSAGANAQYRYDATRSSGFQISEFDTGLQFRINYVMSRALR